MEDANKTSTVKIDSATRAMRSYGTDNVVVARTAGAFCPGCRSRDGMGVHAGSIGAIQIGHQMYHTGQGRVAACSLVLADAKTMENVVANFQHQLDIADEVGYVPGVIRELTAARDYFAAAAQKVEGN